MDSGREDNLLVLELKTLCEEAVQRSQSVENDNDGNERRSLFAIAQVTGSRDLMQYLIDNEEWSEFGDFLEAVLETQEERYWEAWGSNDRKMMTITMAHRRLLKRLTRRLTDPRRRQSLVPLLGPEC